ncbi:hypothetical protein Poli38472_001559 [Pythium oligandrum]|uniref:Outer kinetochore protein DAD2 n=1 Tax=Pythium oligandrum TaxID=41045 RepID=A0A8K1FTA9_PYTOL|nr:hypothetical protein Poli38472_001559 [Pythium oligandrum]|eukprot:TMW69403.1 hypothetical protein Poli38472_001559 [Pythium oligandrum]
MSSKNEEVAALEALRDSSEELVKYLDAMNQKLTRLNEQNELSLRVLENWSSVIAITKATTPATGDQDAKHEILRKTL